MIKYWKLSPSCNSYYNIHALIKFKAPSKYQYYGTSLVLSVQTTATKPHEAHVVCTSTANPWSLWESSLKICFPDNRNSPISFGESSCNSTDLQGRNSSLMT